MGTVLFESEGKGMVEIMGQTGFEQNLWPVYFSNFAGMPKWRRSSLANAGANNEARNNAVGTGFIPAPS